MTSLVEARQVQPAAGKPFPEYANRYALVVGIDKFDGSTTELRFAKSDATQFDALLRQSYGFDSVVLHDTKATKSAIKHAIREIADKCGPDDLFLFYFGGNVTEVPSTESPSGKVASLVPYDFNVNEFSTLELLEDITMLSANHKVVLVDGCHATSGLTPTTISLNSDAKPTEPVLEFFGACRANQFAMEDTKGGVFSQAVMRAAWGNRCEFGRRLMDGRTVVARSSSGFEQHSTDA